MTGNRDKDKWNGCNNCKHLKTGVKCDAFPKGIPMVFASGEVPHFKVVSNQKGSDIWELRN